MQRYVKPFLDAEFDGEGKGHIGTLYWVRIEGNVKNIV